MNRQLTILAATFLGAMVGVVLVTLALGDNPRGGMWQIGGAVVGAMAFSAPFRWTRRR